MKKSKFHVIVVFEKSEMRQERIGLISEHFGIHKERKEEWIVTHLLTGSKIVAFPFLRSARELVERLENTQFPVFWNKKDIKELGANFIRVNRIINSIKYMRRSES